MPAAWQGPARELLYITWCPRRIPVVQHKTVALAEKIDPARRKVSDHGPQGLED
jgi:hypothetical protein